MCELWKSTNGGASWNNVQNYFDNGADMLIDPNSPNILYNGGTPPNGLLGVGKSTDDGLTWTYTQLGSVSGRMFTMAMDPTNSSIIYAAGYENGIQALYKTTNAGANWSKLLATGIGGYYYTLAIDPSNSDIVYAGTYTSVYKSTNGGNSFSSTGFPGGSTRSLLIVNDSWADAIVIYAGTDGNGVYTSNNGGSSWTALNTGLDEPYIRYLSFNAGNRFLYAGTSCASIYRNQIPSVSVKETDLGRRLNEPVIALPNPSAGKTTFCFTLNKPSLWDLTIFDIQGRVIKGFRSNDLGPGTYNISWDGRDNGHRVVPAGIYFYTMKTDAHQHVGKLTVTR